jgi:hypothetical protein
VWEGRAVPSPHPLPLAGSVTVNAKTTVHCSPDSSMEQGVRFQLQSCVSAICSICSPPPLFRVLSFIPLTRSTPIPRADGVDCANIRGVLHVWCSERHSPHRLQALLCWSQAGLTEPHNFFINLLHFKGLSHEIYIFVWNS